jgi:surface protein
MDKFTEDEAGTTAGNNFFISFNNVGAITSLPSGSFDTSKITKVGNVFFTYFNTSGLLTSLPEDSFDTSKIITVGYDFFNSFNYDGALTSLPVGSFNTSKITTVGDGFFRDFNSGGRIPENTNGVQIQNRTNDLITAYYWNGSGSNTEDVKPDNFMYYDSPLVPPVIHEMEFSINTTGNYIITNQWDKIVLVQVNNWIPQELEKIDIHLTENDHVKIIEKNEGDFRTWMEVTNPLFLSEEGIGDVSLTSIPSMDVFTTDIAGTTAGDYFFFGFNHNGLITSLPDDSFDTSNITIAGDYFFSGFNMAGALTSLPVGSFNTINISTLGNDFFLQFNWGGKLAKDPTGVEIFNPNGGIVAYYWVDDHSVEEPVQSQGSMYYSSGSPIPPVDNEIILTVNKQTNYTFNNQWTSTMSIQVNDGSQEDLVDSKDLQLNNGDHVHIIEKNTGDFRVWRNNNSPLVSSANNSTAELISIPPIDVFTSDTAGTTAGNNFFFGFNNNGALTSLRADSFNTSKITTVGNYFFAEFNYYGKLESLPHLSFNTGNITSTGNGFFMDFNNNGALTSLPASSFNTSKITTVGNTFFYNFNYRGLITSLPIGSFNTTNIITVGDYFLAGFNNIGEITMLPVSSFNTSNISKVGDFFFRWFNQMGKIPMDTNGVEIFNPDGNIEAFYWDGVSSHSQDISHGQYMYYSSGTPVPPATNMIELRAQVEGKYIFYNQWKNPVLLSVNSGQSQPLVDLLRVSLKENDIVTISENNENDFRKWGNAFSTLVYPDKSDGNVSLTSIPSMDKFTEDEAGTTVGDNFFAFFNYDGAITSLPSGSFDTSKITNVGNGFFADFNSNGRLTSLPDGSFDTSNITTVGNGFFEEFNAQQPIMGGISILPHGSFNTSNIKSTGNNFLYRFNFQGTISKNIDGVAIYNRSGGSIIGYFFDGDTHTSKSELIYTETPMYYKSK